MLCRRWVGMFAGGWGMFAGGGWGMLCRRWVEQHLFMSEWVGQ